MSEFIVVTEHWPRNPSKPMWLHVETRPIRAKDASVAIEVASKSRKKSKRTGKTFVVKILDEKELREEIDNEVDKEKIEYLQKKILTLEGQKLGINCPVCGHLLVKECHHNTSFNECLNCGWFGIEDDCNT